MCALHIHNEKEWERNVTWRLNNTSLFPTLPIFLLLLSLPLSVLWFFRHDFFPQSLSWFVIHIIFFSKHCKQSKFDFSVIVSLSTKCWKVFKFCGHNGSFTEFFFIIHKTKQTKWERISSRKSKMIKFSVRAASPSPHTNYFAKKKQNLSGKSHQIFFKSKNNHAN